MANSKRSTKSVRPLNIWDREKYFDATFTSQERHAIRLRLISVCGYGEGYRDIPDYIGFERDIERPAQDAVWPVFCAQGLTYERDEDQLRDYAMIHICRQLGIDYKSYAKNVPKLPIDGFIKVAKQTFPEFRQPRNSIERKIQERKLHLLWCDWLDAESARTGCSRWESTRFVKRDYAAILQEIVEYNEKRPKLVTLSEPTRKDIQPKRQKPVLRIAVNNS